MRVKKFISLTLSTMLCLQLLPPLLLRRRLQRTPATQD